MLVQATLERCINGCCHLVDGKAVTEKEYGEAKERHPSRMPGVGPGHRNAIPETVIGCRTKKEAV